MVTGVDRVQQSRIEDGRGMEMAGALDDASGSAGVARTQNRVVRPWISAPGTFGNSENVNPVHEEVASIRIVTDVFRQV